MTTTINTIPSPSPQRIEELQIKNICSLNGRNWKAFFTPLKIAKIAMILEIARQMFDIYSQLQQFQEMADKNQILKTENDQLKNHSYAQQEYINRILSAESECTESLETMRVEIPHDCLRIFNNFDKKLASCHDLVTHFSKVNEINNKTKWGEELGKIYDRLSYEYLHSSRIISKLGNKYL